MHITCLRLSSYGFFIYYNYQLTRHVRLAEALNGEKDVPKYNFFCYFYKMIVQILFHKVRN